MVLYGVADGAENYSFLCEFLLEGGLHRHRVHNGIHRHAAERQSFFERYAELVECLHELRVYLLLLILLLCQRVGIIRDCLVVDLRQVHMSPCGLLERLPVAERLKAELEHPVGLALLLRDQSHNILVETFLYDVGVHVCGEAIFIFLLRHLSHKGIFCIFIFHCCCYVCRVLLLSFGRLTHYRESRDVFDKKISCVRKKNDMSPIKMQNYKISNYYRNVLRFFWLLQLFIRIKKTQVRACA